MTQMEPAVKTQYLRNGRASHRYWKLLTSPQPHQLCRCPHTRPLWTLPAFHSCPADLYVCCPVVTGQLVKWRRKCNSCGNSRVKRVRYGVCGFKVTHDRVCDQVKWVAEDEHDGNWWTTSGWRTLRGRYVCVCVGVLVLSHRQVILSQEFSEEKNWTGLDSWRVLGIKKKNWVGIYMDILVLTSGIRRSENLQTTGTKRNFICLDSGRPGWIDRTFLIPQEFCLGKFRFTPLKLPWCSAACVLLRKLLQLQPKSVVVPGNDCGHGEVTGSQRCSMWTWLALTEEPSHLHTGQPSQTLVRSRSFVVVRFEECSSVVSEPWRKEDYSVRYIRRRQY